MLHRLAEEVAACRRRARAARQQAESVGDVGAKNDLLLVERRWLALAVSFEAAHQVAGLNATAAAGAASLATTASLPPHAACPSCGEKFRLRPTGPTPTGALPYALDFQCRCDLLAPTTSHRQ
jgi:hypothetical protein